MELKRAAKTFPPNALRNYLLVFFPRFHKLLIFPFRASRFGKHQIYNVFIIPNHLFLQSVTTQKIAETKNLRIANREHLFQCLNRKTTIMTKVNLFQYKIFSLKSIVRLNWSADWGRFNKKIERSYSEMHTHFNRGRNFSEPSKNFFGFLELLSVIFYPKWRAIQSIKNYKAFLGEFPIILK